jgi:hypothetical protein
MTGSSQNQSKKQADTSDKSLLLEIVPLSRARIFLRQRNGRSSQATKTLLEAV